MTEISKKIEFLGGIEVKIQERPGGSVLQETLDFVQQTMHAVPEDILMSFIEKYGFGRFKNNVYGKIIEKTDFLNGEDIEIGGFYGFGSNENNIRQIIDCYHIAEQLDASFFPIAEGYPGDLIYYSLEKETFGKIYYWHHESPLGMDRSLVQNSFTDFIRSMFVQEEEEVILDVLSDAELIKVNEKRKKFGLPLIDKYRNSI